MAGTAVVIGYGLYRRELLRLFVTWLLLIGLTPKISSNSAHNKIHDNDAAKDTLNGLLKLGGARELAMASQPGAKQAPLEVD